MHYSRLIAAILAAALFIAAPARADTTIYSPTTTPIISTDWTDLGAGPADVQNLSVGNVYIAAAASKPSASALGAVLSASAWKTSYSVSTHLWARATDASVTSAAKSPVVAVTSYAGAIVAGGQKITTTATIASGQTVSGAIDLGTARFWAMTTPAALTATAVTFLASQDCSTYSALYDSTGTAVSWTVSTSRYIVNASPAQWLSVRCFKLSIASSEGADRTFSIEAVP